MRQAVDWNGRYEGEMTEEAIRAMYQPAGRYRLRLCTYPAATRFCGTMISGHCYVLSGSSKYRFGADEFMIEQGQFVELPEGHYWYDSSTEKPTVMLLAWKLPEKFWQLGSS